MRNFLIVVFLILGSCYLMEEQRRREEHFDVGSTLGDVAGGIGGVFGEGLGAVFEGVFGDTEWIKWVIIAVVILAIIGTLIYGYTVIRGD